MRKRGTRHGVRRPLTWEMIRVMEESIGAWGAGGKIVWIGLALTYQLLLRASELFAEEGGKVQQVQFLRRGDVAFFEKGVQMGPGRREATDTVEIRSKGRKGDQGRKGAVAVRTQGFGGVGGGPERNIVDLMVELVGYYGKPVPGGENAPLTTYRGGGRWKVWRKGQATSCLSSGLERVGRKLKEQVREAVGELVPEEIALHSGRIGGATRLAEMGAQPWVIQREGRWALQAFMGCVRSNMEDPFWVSSILVGR